MSQRILSACIASACVLASAWAQAQSSFTLTTTSSNLVTNLGTSNLVVDNALAITGTGNVTDATATVSSGFQSGDVLSYDLAALPSGVSGSFSSTTGILTFTGTSSAANYQSLLRTVKISLSSSSATTRAVTFTLGDLVAYTNGHYYKYVSNSIAWTSAKSAASNSGNNYFGLTGYLATITSSGENAFIKQALSADGWIGASDEYSEINAATGTTTYSNQTSSEGHWYWVTGPEAGTNFSNGNNTPTVVSGQYMNWTGSEPNNSGNVEHYGEIYASGSNQGLWNDLSNSSNNGYIVEYGGMPGDPTLQLTGSRLVKVRATSVDGTYNYNATTYHTNASAVVVDGSLNISSTANITDARVTISSGFNSGDVLGYNSGLLSGMSASYSSSTGVLSFTGTVTPAQLQALLRSVTFNTTAAPNVNREITFSIGNLVANTNGHFYKFVSASGTSWTSAVSGAAAQSYLGYTGYLATITSSSENAFIVQTLGNDGWIGASDDYAQINSATGTTTFSNQSNAEGNWYWITGPEAGTKFSTGNNSPSLVAGQYMNWNTGEPNNSAGNENYGMIYMSGTPGKWNDGSGNLNGYIVEFGGLTSDPVITLASTSKIIVGSPLPIDGLQLQASARNNQVHLQWNTLNERGTQYFDIERSANAQDFQSIGLHQAIGKGFNNYSFLDEHPLSLAYYRIKALDADGSFLYSGTQMVKLEHKNLAPQLSPNPATDYIHLSRSEAAPATLSCYDLAGRLLFQQQVSGTEMAIRVQQLLPGSYTMQLDEQGTKTTLRFVKK
ncbi:MAG: T9SS type A sorting domain-containing protein [Bacteroidetes bacterium]|nr:T9SS type A sorting domain-containing protein [Bacteroidota bacterium]MBS1630408.1 T9SS type A sorting domain-containing protein [Bacteroidota bacterium]